MEKGAKPDTQLQITPLPFTKISLTLFKFVSKVKIKRYNFTYV